MVSVVSSSQTRHNFKFLRHLEVNFVHKWQECQICVIYEKLECWRSERIPCILIVLFRQSDACHDASKTINTDADVQCEWVLRVHLYWSKSDFYRSQTKFCEGYVFSPVCYSVHRGEEGLPQCMLGYTPLLRSACWEIRATSGQYASYWNAYLFVWSLSLVPSL